MANRLIISLGYLMFLLLPWYYLKSGNIQPVDIVIITLLCMLLLSRQIYQFNLMKTSSITLTLTVMIIYFFFSLTVNYILLNNSETLILISENFYIILICMSYLSFMFYLYRKYEKQQFYEKILRLLLSGTIIPLAFILFAHHTTMARGCLSFNNPNQLGAYALLNIAVLVYITLFARSNELIVNKSVSLILINIYLLFFIISASRAAFGLLFLYIFSYFIIFRVKQIRDNPIVSLFFITLILVFPCWILLNKLLIRIVMVRNSGTFVLTDMQSDIYTRIFLGMNYNLSHLFIFLFGTGSSSNPLRPSGLEFHNNFMGIFNQSGTIGLILYILFHICILRSLLKQGILYLVPYICYLELSFFHFTLRERINWYLLAVIIFLSVYQKIDRALSRTNHSSTTIVSAPSTILSSSKV